MTQVAFLGCGIMGAPMARRLLEHGHNVHVWNRTAAKAEALGDAGAQVAPSAADAVRAADVIITMLSDGPAVEAVMLGDGGGLAAAGSDSLWLQMATVGPAASERFATAAKERRVAYVDVPVLGTRLPAERGELVLLASGPEALRPRCQPLFDAMGKKTLWLGPTGTASRLKLVVNTWVVGMVGLLAETLQLAKSLGVAPESFLSAIEGGALDADYAHIKGKAMLTGDFTPSFPMRLALKDARLILEAAAGDALPMRVTRAVADAFSHAIEQGHGSDDMAAVFAALR